MANRSEVIAILSSGVSFKRFLLPFAVGGLFFTLLLWAANQYVIPHANTRWANFNSKYIDFNYRSYVNTSTVSNKYFRLDSFSYAGVRFYDTTTKTGSNFFIQRFKDEQLTYNLRAQTLRYDTSNNQWRLENVTERYIDGLRHTVVDTPALVLNLNFKPRDLQLDDYMKDKMTTPELTEFIELERMRGSENVNSLVIEKQNRTATPVSVFILTIIGAILASRKIRGGSGFHLALGVLICVIYILVGRFSSVFSLKGDFDPVVATWLPNVIFGFLAWYLYKKSPK